MAAATMPRTRVDRIRAAVGIAQLTLQQIEDDLTGDIDALHDEADPPGGVFGSFAQLLTVTAQRAEQLEPDRDGDASCPLHEAAALVIDDAGQRIHWAARALVPQGDSE
ncbi:hypothetical protein [Streptomyces sp. 8N706]|uniref:hypothetical protein n=1 Tax=Streptomyces sp. 8N706 TaxID=3457416 RepID=UPI003FD24414